MVVQYGGRQQWLPSLPNETKQFALFDSHDVVRNGNQWDPEIIEEFGKWVMRRAYILLYRLKLWTSLRAPLSFTPACRILKQQPFPVLHQDTVVLRPLSALLKGLVRARLLLNPLFLGGFICSFLRPILSSIKFLLSQVRTILPGGIGASWVI